MKAVARVSRPTAADAEKQLKAFIDKFEPKHQALIRAVRRALRKRLPSAHELIYDNYNFFVIGYSPTERPSDAIVSIAAGAKVWACASFEGRSCAIPRRSSSAPAIRPVSCVSSQPTSLRDPRSKSCWPRPLPRRRRPRGQRNGESSSSDRFRRSSVRVGSDP